MPYWRLSSFYLFYFASLGALIPYWGLYLKHLGFNIADIGTLMAIIMATKVISPNIWGWIADHTGKRMAIVRLGSLLAAITFACVFWVQSYWWLALVMLLFSFFWNAALPQFEAATMLHLKAEPQRYSRIRLWGSVGFIVAVLGIGRFLDYFSINFLPWIIGTLLALNCLVALLTPDVTFSHVSKADNSLFSLLFKPELLAFFLVYLLLQVAHGPYYVFYSVYLQQHDYTATLTGLLWALGVAAEVLIFIWMYGLIKRVSLRAMLLSSLALSMLRWLMIAYGVDFFSVIVCAQLLHAASFGVAHVVAIQFIHRYFGGGHQSKGQALYSSLSFGLGGMLGSFFSGYFWDLMGGETVFVIAALASGLALLIAFIGVGRPQTV